MNFLNNIESKSIIEGVIAGFIFFILVLIFKRIGGKFIPFVSKLNIRYKNSIYVEASNSDLDKYGNQILVEIYTVIFVFCLIPIILLKTELDGFIEKLLNLKVENGVKVPSLGKTEVLDYNQTLSDAQNMRFIFYGLLCFLTISMIWTFLRLIRTNQSHKLITQFNKQIKILRPISDKEDLEFLEMKWATMETKEDWDSIQETIFEKMKSFKSKIDK